MTLRRVMAASTHAGQNVIMRMAEPGGQGYVDRLPEPDGLPSWLSQHELDYYVGEFARSGFTGALNWYRNFDRNWELTAHPPAATIVVPALSVIGDNDPLLTFSPGDRAAEVVSGPYRSVIINSAGHCIQQERPDEINMLLLEFLTDVSMT